MAFQFFTNDKIKAIDVRQIPTSFKQYYESLSEQRKEEVKDLRPDLISALYPESSSDPENIPTDTDANEFTERLVDQWESMPASVWRSYKIDTDVVVCKVIPNGLKKCKIHRILLESKQLNIRMPDGGVQYVVGKYCPECFDFFVEEDRATTIARVLSERGIPALFQPLTMTLEEWKETAAPLDVGESIPIFVPDSWIENAPSCPVCKTELVPDRYRRSYKDRSVIFDAWCCDKCQKILMRNADAQQLEEHCTENGVPVDFLAIREEKKLAPVKKGIIPDWVVSSGKKLKNTLTCSDWPVLEEKDTVIISDSPVCRIDGHDNSTEDVTVTIRVEKKRGGIAKGGIEDYLVETGFCRICGKYYMDTDDFNLLAEEGRLQVTLIDDTDTFHSVTSGDSFIRERQHLSLVEGDINKEITRIKKLPAYTEKYEVIHYYDEGDLKDRKSRSSEYHKWIEELDGLKPLPYRYRVDLVHNKRKKTYYLGAKDIKLNPENEVISFNNTFGKKIVNVRTTEIEVDGKKWKVKLRRDFDIQNAILYSFLETSDKDAVFRAGITDPFLVKVLNTRKRQHQLVDIISTIQENQNAIVDESPDKDIIVQGCAGSGKTMVLLHRLSSLRYNYRNYDFSKVIILTPNVNFNTHIQNLASSLQIDIITRYSVEEYYRELLRRYEVSLAPGGRIIDESSVNQAYVDYLYSDDFFAHFARAYETKIRAYRELCEELNSVSTRLGRNGITEIPHTGNELFDTIIKEMNALGERINMLESDFREASNGLKHAEERWISAKRESTEMEQQFQRTVSRESLNALAVLERKREENLELISNTRAGLEEEEKRITTEISEYHISENLLRETLATVIDSLNAELEKERKYLDSDLKDARVAVSKNKENLFGVVEEIKRQISQREELIRFECEGLIDELLKAEKSWRDTISETEQKIKDKEKELITLENRFFVTGRAAKRERLYSEISVLQQDKLDLLAEMEEIHRFMQEAEYCKDPEHCFSLFQIVAPYLDDKTVIPSSLLEKEYEIEISRQQIVFLKSRDQNLQENVNRIEDSIRELQEVVNKTNTSITADSLPDYLKRASGFLENSDDYLDMIRPVRRELREHKDRIDESRSVIKRLQKQKEESQNILDLYEGINSINYHDISAENYEQFFQNIVDILPETKSFLGRIKDQERRLKTEKDRLPTLEHNYQEAEKRLSKAKESRIDQIILGSYNKIKEKTRMLNPKDLYQEVFSGLFVPENSQIDGRFKKYFQQSRGVHRYDLYLMLRFAMLFYDKLTGEAQLICIDEGQDLTPNEYQMIKKINRGRAVFNVYGDTCQLLKPNRGVSDWRMVKDILRNPSEYVLNENYRNTNQITQYCNDYFTMNVQQTGADGREVKELNRSHLEKALSEFASEESRCALILPRAVNKETYLDQSKLSENTKKVLGTGIGRGLIALVYVDEIKGVEFDEVFVVPNGMTKNEKYIAFTRALSVLTVVIDNDIPPVSDLILKETAYPDDEDNQKQQMNSFSGIKVGKVLKKKKHKEEDRVSGKQR